MQSFQRLLEYLKVAHPDDQPQTIPALDKLPTNEFIENFLDDDEEDDGDGKSNIEFLKPTPVLKPFDEDATELESTLDISEKFLPYDDTGQRAYENACSQYKTLPCRTFHKKLGYASTIDMKHYNLGPHGAKAIAVPMVINTKITHLNLSGNDLSKKGIEEIGKMMAENTSITDLDLSDNNLCTHGAKVIAKILNENHALRSLNISNNQFLDSDACILCKPIEEHPNLKTINLSSNQFGDFAASHIRTMISENGVLQEVDISWNHIRGKGAVEVAKGVKENIGLKMLNVSWNGFGEQGGIEMGKALHTSTLHTLEMSSARIGANAFAAICAAMRDNDDLRVIKLCRNPIPEEAASAGLLYMAEKIAPEDFNLQELNLGDVMLSPAFGEQVQKVKEIHPNFECPHGYTDSYGKRKLKQYDIVEDAMRALKKYADERDINIIDLFARFDADGSMSVSHEEFKIGLKEAKVPVTDEQIKALINALDEDGDGEIDFSEMVLGVERYKDED